VNQRALKNFLQSKFFSLFAIAGILLACITPAQAINIQEIWQAPLGTLYSEPAQVWQKNLALAIKQQPLHCSKTEAPDLIPGIPSKAYKLKVSTSATESVIYLMDPITERLILVQKSSEGCYKTSVTGRSLNFKGRDIPSPFPNTVYYPINEQNEFIAVIQDRKTIRPWFQQMEHSEFKINSYLSWMLIAAYCGTLIVIAIAAAFIDPTTGHRRMSQAYVFYVISLLFWVLQNFGLGQAWLPFWPGAEHFSLLQGISLLLLISSTGIASIEFLELKGAARTTIKFGVGLSALFFLSSAWFDAGYILGSLTIAPVALVLIWQLFLHYKLSDLSKLFFSLGLTATLAGGGIQAFSVIAGGDGLNWITVFAFPIGSLIQALFWMIGLTAKIRSNQKSLRKKLIFDAEHDVLTQLPNRAYLHHRMVTHLEKSQSGSCYGLLFIDIDRFKVVNDSLGHSIGDKLLQNISQQILKIASDTCTVARFGGDEFLVLIEKPCQQNEATTLANQIVNTLALPVQLDELELRINASIGIAILNKEYKNVDYAIRDADTALQVAKQTGRGKYVLFDSTMREKAEKRFHLENEIHVGIEKEEFEMFFQPIILLEDMSHVGFEALVRWIHPKRGIVSPDNFIPIAEDTGSIRDLGNLILRQSIKAIGHWRKEGLWKEGWYVSINVSGEQLYDDSLPEFIDFLLEKFGVRSTDIRVELTETAVISNQTAADHVLPNLRKKGIKICMDDFGTGYSSLSYLRVLPFDILKIDKSFIDDVTDDVQSKALVKTVLTLAKEMGFLVVAEGIETESQSTLLNQMHCNYGQGYFYSRPMPKKEAKEWLKKHL